MAQYNPTPDRYIELNQIIKEIKKYKFLFIAFIVIAVGVAYILNKIGTPKYMIKASMVIQVQTQNRQQSPNSYINEAELYPMQTSFDNELIVLKSSVLIEHALKELGFYVSYYHKKGFIKEEVYKKNPYTIAFNHDHIQPTNADFKVKFLNQNEYLLEIDEKNATLYRFDEDKIVSKNKAIKFSKTCKIGQTVETDYFAFTLLLNQGIKAQDLKEHTFYFGFNNVFDLTKSYANKLKVEKISQLTTIANISLISSSVDRGVDFLNELLNQYLQQSIEQKEFMISKTLDYIDKQLYNISDSLNYEERRLQDFRINNQTMNVTEKSGQVQTQIQALENERSLIMIKKQYYLNIKDHFEKNKDISDVLIPSYMGVDDPLLTQLIQQIINLNNEKVKMINNNLQKNPYFEDLNNQIANVKSTIEKNINYNISTININYDNIVRRIQQYKNEIERLPVAERELLGIERKFKLTDAIYTFLLEKRSEAQIAKASNISGSKIIESASFAGKVFPDPKINYAAAIFLALLIPGVIVITKNIFNDTFTDRNEIEKATNLPVLGQIYHNYRKVETVFVDHPKSAIAESFRSVRTNLDYFADDTAKRTFLVSSTQGREGKSFVSLNLALCFAGNGRKTLVIDMDLRKPTLHTKLQCQNIIGVTSYLINKATIDDIVMESIYPNLYFISSGPLPPNPSELIGSKKTVQLLERLKEKFDTIIIDSPPLGIVTDAFLLMHYSDVKIYIIRQNSTKRSDFYSCIKDVQQKGIQNIGLLVNDVTSNTKGKYGYGYYSETPSKKQQAKIKSKQKSKKNASSVDVKTNSVS